MFSIGKEYVIKTWEPGEDGGVVTEHHNCTVTDFQFPLVKINRFGKTWILNTSAPVFVEASTAD